MTAPAAIVAIDDGHLQHLPGHGRDRQERAIGGAALGAERGQDHVPDRVVVPEHLDQRAVEAPARVALRGREKFVVETERIEEGSEPRIIVMAEARVLAERVRHLRQRLAEMRGHHLLVGDIVGHLPEPVHVVGEADQAGRHLVLGEHAEGMAHHGGAGDLAERADMRQARRPVAGLEDDGAGRLADVFEPAQDFARLLERPGLALLGVRQ